MKCSGALGVRSVFSSLSQPREDEPKGSYLLNIAKYSKEEILFISRNDSHGSSQEIVEFWRIFLILPTENLCPPVKIVFSDSYPYRSLYGIESLDSRSPNIILPKRIMVAPAAIASR